MLVVHSSSLFYTPIKPSFGKYSTKTNVRFSCNQPKLNNLSKKNSKKYASFTFRCHQPAVEVKAAAAENADEGIGILNFFQGKNIFVTGATGLLGKGMHHCNFQWGSFIVFLCGIFSVALTTYYHHMWSTFPKSVIVVYRKF